MTLRQLPQNTTRRSLQTEIMPVAVPLPTEEWQIRNMMKEAVRQRKVVGLHEEVMDALFVAPLGFAEMVIAYWTLPLLVVSAVSPHISWLKDGGGWHIISLVIALVISAMINGHNYHKSIKVYDKQGNQKDVSWMVNRSRTRPCGPLSYLAYRIAQHRIVSRRMTMVNSPIMTRDVTHYISSSTLHEYAVMERRTDLTMRNVEGMLSDVKQAINRYAVYEDGGQRESADQATRDVALAKLIQLRAIETKFQSQKETLSRQREQAHQAIEPVKRLLDDLDHLAGVERDLVLLQSAYAVADQADIQIAFNTASINRMKELCAVAATQIGGVSNNLTQYEKSLRELNESPIARITAG